MKENHKNLCKNLIEEQELIREIKKKEKVSYSLENRIKIGMIIILQKELFRTRMCWKKQRKLRNELKQINK